VLVLAAILLLSRKRLMKKEMVSNSTGNARVFSQADRPASIQSDRFAIRRDRFRPEKDEQYVECDGKLLFEEV
jgi:hypothetical protein